MNKVLVEFACNHCQSFFIGSEYRIEKRVDPSTNKTIDYARAYCPLCSTLLEKRMDMPAMMTLSDKRMDE